MRRVILTLAAVAMGVTSLSAQLAGSSNMADIRNASRGMLLNRDIMTISDMGNIARSSALQYGTARSMGMAGALTSLGGDASSMFINPAGLGMAIDSDITITPLMTFQKSTNSGSEYYKNDVRNFSLANFSTTFNLYEDSHSKLVSLNFGLGYNRMADYNYGYSFCSIDNPSSIARLFSSQLTSDKINVYDFQGNNNPDWSALPADLWGAALGFKTGLTDAETSDTEWGSTWISDDASIDQFMAVESSGSLGEFDIAMGANVDNKLYLGFTLGIQSLYQRLDLLYGEEYYNPDSFGVGMKEYDVLGFSNYNQAIITRGIGINVKLGATYRVNDSFRIGLAYHSPTKYSINREYQASMASQSTHVTDGIGEIRNVSVDSPLIEDLDENNWQFRSPSKILVGGSLAMGNRALFAFDFERAWYGSMAMRYVPEGVSMAQYNNINEIYKAVNTYRLGGEFKLSPEFAVRGGYSFSDTMVGDKEALLDVATADKINYYSAGIGYSPNRGFSIDLTYMCQTTDYTDYTTFYSVDAGKAGQSNRYSTKLIRNNIALSLVFRM